MSRPVHSAETTARKPESADFELAWRRRFVEFAASREDDAGIAGWTPSGLEARVRKFLSLWQAVREKQLWLDAGCGAGTYTRLLSEQGLSVVAVDYSFPASAKACARDTLGNMYAVADVRRLPFRDKAFSGIVCFGVTQALSRSDVLVGELARLIASGGELWIDGLNAYCLPHLAERSRRFFARRQMHLHYEVPTRIVYLMRHFGFVDVKRYWMPIAPARMPGLQRLFERPPLYKVLNVAPFVGALASHSFIVHGRRPL